MVVKVSDVGEKGMGEGMYLQRAGPERRCREGHTGRVRRRGPLRRRKNNIEKLTSVQPQGPMRCKLTWQNKEQGGGHRNMRARFPSSSGARVRESERTSVFSPSRG